MDECRNCKRLRARLASAHKTIEQLAPGSKFVSFKHQDGNPVCPCDSCTYEREMASD